MPFIECFNVNGGLPDPRAPITRGKRAHVSIDEFNEMARRQGMTPPG